MEPNIPSGYKAFMTNVEVYFVLLLAIFKKNICQHNT